MICEKSKKNQRKIKNRSFFFLVTFSFLTSLLTIKTLKKVDIQDIRISGSDLFSQSDVVNNSSLKFPIRLILIKTNLLEKDLKQNLSLKNVSVKRELFPFGLKVSINNRIPIAYGERIFKPKGNNSLFTETFLRDKFCFNSFSNKLVLIEINRIGNFKDELFTTSFCENNSLPEILIS